MFMDISNKLIELYFLIKLSWLLCWQSTWFSPRDVSLWFNIPSLAWYINDKNIRFNIQFLHRDYCLEKFTSPLMSQNHILHLLLADSDIWLLACQQSDQQSAHHVHSEI